jgi:hypothetical protein
MLTTFLGDGCIRQDPSEPQCDVTLGLDDNLRKLDRTFECFSKIKGDPTLELWLPKKSSLPGLVVKHTMETVDKILEKQWPAVFKFGFTHCPHFRFWNKFGYAVDKHQKWQMMCVLFASHESTGPAFLEASLIQKYKGNLHCFINFSPFGCSPKLRTMAQSY